VSWRSPPIEAGPETATRLVPIPLAAGALSHGQTTRQTLIDSSIAPRMNTRLIPCFGCATCSVVLRREPANGFGSCMEEWK
jgi:hypothetical protein